LPHQSETAGVDAFELATRVTGLQSKAKESIRQSILMLDLAAQHARQLATRLRDPAAKASFDAHIMTIEQLLQLARDMTMKL
jgi:hypothetical protein